MKTVTLSLLLCSFLPISCANYSGNGYHATIIGTNHKKYHQTADTLDFDESNQSQVALSAIRTTGTITSAWIAMKGMLGISDNSTKEVVNASDNALKATKESEITKRVMHTVPSPALP